jgi:polyphosphate kinase
MDGAQISTFPPPPQAAEKAPVPALAPVPAPEVLPVQSLSDARFFINRELSWLAFDERVLEEACDPQVPALERLKFLAITSSNLDEFFMIRVAGLKQQLVGHVEETGPDALTPAEQLAAISARCHAMVARQYKALMQDVLPNLERAGVRLLRGQLSTEADAFVDEYFWREVFPVLTPIALDPGHPFPHLRNKSLNLAVRFSAGTPGGRLRYGLIPVPSVLPRLVEVRDSGRRSYVLLEDVIARHAAQLFPGMPIEGCYPFRVTRNWDISIDEEEAEDLLVTIEREVRRRDRGSAVRLEIAAQAEQPMVDYLVRALKLGPGDLYRPDGPLDIPDLLSLLCRIEQKELHDEPFTPVIPPQIGDGERDLFRLIRERTSSSIILTNRSIRW